MRFVQFHLKSGGSRHLGVQTIENGDIYDLTAADSVIPNSLVEFIKGGSGFIEKATRIVADKKCMVHLNDVQLLSPISEPNKIACVGLNYKNHCDEHNQPYPTEPVVFSKFASSIVGPYDNIVLPSTSKKVDWEVELAILIGNRCKDVRKEDANDYIFGYTIAQDVSSRDLQFMGNNGQWLLSKSLDTFCPLGPAVVTKDALDVNNLKIKCSVNGTLKQSSVTSELIFKCDDIVSYMSKFFTLYPGDIILTGTPSGVGHPNQYLAKGDIVESEIEGIGLMRNEVV